MLSRVRCGQHVHARSKRSELNKIRKSAFPSNRVPTCKRGFGSCGVQVARRFDAVTFGGMNNNSRIFSLLALVCMIAVPAAEIHASSRVATASPSLGGHPTARLIVQRAPNFGNDLVVRLLIDGARVADIPRNQHYGGVLSAGRHVLTVLALPNTGSRRPTSIRLTLQSGHVYIFTATWESDRLVLRPSNSYSPTARVPAVRN
jgi:hypothetical protein